VSLAMRCCPSGVVYSQWSSAIGSSIRVSFGRHCSSGGTGQLLMVPWVDPSRPDRIRRMRLFQPGSRSSTCSPQVRSATVRTPGGRVS
jgi:hypothetical protein